MIFTLSFRDSNLGQAEVKNVFIGFDFFLLLR